MDSLARLPDQAFVEFCYRFFLGRNADPEGLAGCLASLASGAPRIELIRGLTSSDEYFRLVHSREQREESQSQGQVWTRYRIDEVVDVDPVTASVRSYIEQCDVRALLRIVAGYIEIRSACEVGCGFGRVTQVLTEFAASVWGFEREPLFVELATRSMPRIHFVQTEHPGQLAAADGQFDFALTFTFLQHLTDRVAASAIAEIQRVTCAGGFVLCCEETDVAHQHGETDNPKGKCTIGRSVDTYERLFHPFALERTIPRRIEPNYPRPDVGTYMLFRAPGHDLSLRGVS